MAAVVDVDRQPGIVDDVVVGRREPAGVLEDLALSCNPAHSPAKRRCVERVADAEADDDDALGRVHREQRQMSEGAHVPLAVRARPRHQVAVGHERPALPRHVGDRHDLGDAFAHVEPALVRAGRPERVIEEMARGQRDPQRDGRRRRSQGQRERRGGRPPMASGNGVDAERDIEGHDGEGSDDDQHRHAPLHAEAREQDESRRQRSRQCAHRVGEIQESRAAPHHALGVLDAGVGQRIGEAHGERRDSELTQERAHDEPQLERVAPPPRARQVRGIGGGLLGQVSAEVGRGQARQGGDHENALSEHVEHRRAPEPRVQEPASDGADPDAGKNHGEDQRQHRSEASREHVHVSEPDDLDPHRGKTGQHDGGSGQCHHA